MVTLFLVICSLPAMFTGGSWIASPWPPTHINAYMKYIHTKHTSLYADKPLFPVTIIRHIENVFQHDCTLTRYRWLNKEIISFILGTQSHVPKKEGGDVDTRSPSPLAVSPHHTHILHATITQEITCFMRPPRIYITSYSWAYSSVCIVLL